MVAIVGQPAANADCDRRGDINQSRWRLQRAVHVTKVKSAECPNPSEGQCKPQPAWFADSADSLTRIGPGGSALARSRSILPMIRAQACRRSFKMHRTLLSALITCCSALGAIGCSSTDLVLSTPTGAKCQVAVDNSLAAVSAAGATGTLTVTTTPECEWVATTATSWIAITSTPQSQGSGTVSYRVSANADPSGRAGTVIVNTAQIAITQEAAPCRFSVAPLAPSAGAAGGNLEIRVDTSGSCAWQTTSQVSWIRLTSAASQTGSGTVTLAIDVNGGSARSGAVTIAGQTVTVAQAATASAACTYSVSPITAAVPVEGGSVSVRVTTSPTCAWQASSQAAWIVAAAAGSGTGSGTVTLAIDVNGGSARSGTITIAGQTVTIAQAATVSVACTYSVSPITAAVPVAGGNVAVHVTTSPTCTWQASSQAAWIVAAAAGSGTGSGTITLAVAASTSSSPRVGTVSVAGQTVTVTQAAAAPVCTFSISPTRADVARPGGIVTVTVTTAAGCAWTARSNAQWLSIASGAAGTGPGPVRVDVDRLTGNANERTATVTIAGQTFRVTQER